MANDHNLTAPYCPAPAPTVADLQMLVISNCELLFRNKDQAEKVMVNLASGGRGGFFWRARIFTKKDPGEMLRGPVRSSVYEALNGLLRLTREKVERWTARRLLAARKGMNLLHCLELDPF